MVGKKCGKRTKRQSATHKLRMSEGESDLQSITISTKITYSATNATPQDVVDALNIIVSQRVAYMISHENDRAGRISIGEFYLPSDEDAIEALESLNDALGVASIELECLKSVLGMNGAR